MKKALTEWLAAALTMTVLDFIWLGVIARNFYAQALGPLLRNPAHGGAAATFYLFYVSCVWLCAVRSTQNPIQGWLRGAAMGAFAYGVYELTNWAVIAGWPPRLVPVDWIWGTVLTGTCAAAGVLAGQKKWR